MHIELANGFRLHSRELGDLIREFTRPGMEPDLAFAIQDETVYMTVDDEEVFELRRTEAGTLQLHDGDEYRWPEDRDSEARALADYDRYEADSREWEETP